MIFKWDTIKDKCVGMCKCNTFGALPHANSFYISAVMEAVACGHIDWRGKSKELQKKCEDIIDAWDIRMAKKLIDLFPNCIPTRFHNRTPKADYNEKGEWVLIYE